MAIEARDSRSRLPKSLSEFWQLGKIDSNPPRLVFGSAAWPPIAGAAAPTNAETIATAKFVE
jgi:hypothetical protein